MNDVIFRFYKYRVEKYIHLRLFIRRQTGIFDLSGDLIMTPEEWGSFSELLRKREASEKSSTEVVKNPTSLSGEGK